MNSKEFTIWLKGFLTKKTTLNDADVSAIKEELKNIVDNGISINPYAPFFPIEPAVESSPLVTECSKCGLKFTDEMGRPIPMGYVCARVDCPCGLAGPTFSATPPTTPTA